MRKSGKKYEIVVKSWKKWLKVGKTGEKLGKWRKVGINGESWGKEGKSGKKWQKVAKWRPPAILDDRKSLSIAFLAISDQYATLFFLIFFQNGRWRKSEVRFAPKTIGFFHYMLSMAMPNMKLVGEFVTQLEMPQAF